MHLYVIIEKKRNIYINIYIKKRKERRKTSYEKGYDCIDVAFVGLSNCFIC